MHRPALPRPHRFVAALTTVCFALVAGCNVTTPAPSGEMAAARSDPERVGRHTGGRSVTPVNQVITPLGRVVELPGLRPQALALTPDGRSLLVSGKTSELLVIDPVS
ncbi:MAG: hypothetical protein ACKOTE_07885, partial [Opitutaceae bacterium]